MTDGKNMAFINCPWKSTASCNFICETCFRSDPEGFKPMLDDINRLTRRLEALERKEEEDNG